MFWNKGYTSEAASAVINFMINNVGLDRIQAIYDVLNIASGSVMQKIGMKYEGFLRHYQLDKNGKKTRYEYLFHYKK